MFSPQTGLRALGRGWERVASMSKSGSCRNFKIGKSSTQTVASTLSGSSWVVGQSDQTKFRFCIAEAFFSDACLQPSRSTKGLPRDSGDTARYFQQNRQARAMSTIPNEIRQLEKSRAARGGLPKRFPKLGYHRIRKKRAQGDPALYSSARR